MYIVVTVENVNIVHMYVAYTYALRGQGSQDPLPPEVYNDVLV